MRTITPLSGQSIFDIAAMTCGSAEIAYDIALRNDISITDDIEGIELVIDNSMVANKKVVEYYAVNSINPATAL